MRARNQCVPIKKIFIIKAFILSFLILLGTTHPFFTILSLLLAIQCVVFEKTEIGMGILFFLLPYAGVFKVYHDGFALLNIIVFIFILKLLYDNRFAIPKRSLLLILIFFIFAFMIGWGNGLFELVKLCMYFLLATLFLFHEKRPSLKNILIIFSLGIISAAFYGTISDFFPNLQNYIGDATLRTIGGDDIGRFSGLYNNPNFYTMDIIIALSCWVCFVISGKIQKRDIIIFVILSAFGFMSISNSFLLSYFILIFFTFFAMLQRSVIKGIAFSVVLLFIMAILYIFLDDQFVYAYLDRFLRMGEASDVSIITTGRSTIWMDYLVYITLNLRILFFGSGIGTSLERSAHNFYVETIFSLGIIGSLLYISILTSIFRFKDVDSKKSFFKYLPMIIFLFRASAINLLLRDNTIFFFILIFLCRIEDFAHEKCDKKLCTQQLRIGEILEGEG